MVTKDVYNNGKKGLNIKNTTDYIQCAICRMQMHRRKVLFMKGSQTYFPRFIFFKTLLTLFFCELRLGEKSQESKTQDFFQRHLSYWDFFLAKFVFPGFFP